MKRKIKSIFLLTFVLYCMILPTNAKTLLNEDYLIPSLSYISEYFETTQNQLKIKLAIDISFESVKVSVMNEANYTMWQGGYLANTYFSKTVSKSEKFDVTLGPPGKYFIVLENGDSFFSAYVDVEVTTRTIGESAGIAIGVTVGVAAVIFGVNWFTRNKGPKQIDSIIPTILTPKGSIQLEEQEEQGEEHLFKFCDGCGEKADTDDDYCPYCGIKI